MERTSKINEGLARLTERQRQKERARMTNIRDEQNDIIMSNKSIGNKNRTRK